MRKIDIMRLFLNFLLIFSLCLNLYSLSCAVVEKKGTHRLDWVEYYKVGKWQGEDRYMISGCAAVTLQGKEGLNKITRKKKVTDAALMECHRKILYNFISPYYITKPGSFPVDVTGISANKELIKYIRNNSHTVQELYAETDDEIVCCVLMKTQDHKLKHKITNILDGEQ